MSEGLGGLFSWKSSQKPRASPVAGESNKLVSYCVVEEEASSANGEDADDWDLCSDDKQQLSSKNSSSNSNSNSNSNNLNHCTTTSISTQDVFVARAGSVRSINTLDGESIKSGPSFKMQRTHSSSTIDSNEQKELHSIGPSGKGVLGVDYLEHVILPTDTLQGICIAYKISTTRLRQANHFSGNSLLLAPKKLVIPISKKALQSGFIRVQDTDAKEYKLYSFLAEFHKNQFVMTEAKAYLELADWDLKHAIRSAREDVEWEREMDGTSSDVRKSGEIRITAGTTKHTFQMQGAGAFGKQIAPTVSHSDSEESESDDDDEPTARPTPTTRRPTVVPYSAVPAISNKTVQPQDVYRAASTQDGTYGVELKDIKHS